ncbi:MAG: DUF503 domain-containing protein [Defluviitaleaceae bacterium]|nr:DUF503 domain-containing protein [Defluviitaleaceae bacterium]MCL2835403.1 DUF503 domain-containing protein [Defluviitaleaceae bacterium]
MYIMSAKLTFYISHASSLKDKRQVSRSLIDKAKRRFNASVAEVGTQDKHQSLTIGVSLVSGEAARVRQSLDEIIRFMEEAADAELVHSEYTEDSI